MLALPPLRICRRSVAAAEDNDDVKQAVYDNNVPAPSNRRPTMREKEKAEPFKKIDTTQAKR